MIRHFAPTSIFSEKWLTEYFTSGTRPERIALMCAGAEELHTWLLDLFGQGLSQLQTVQKFELENLAKRMVDCQNGSLARRLRLIAADTEKTDWDEIQSIRDLLELYFLCKAMKKLNQLPLLLKAELLQIAGMSWRKKDLEEVKKVSDSWICLHLEADWLENLHVNTAWFWGVNKHIFAKVNLYAFRFEPFSHSFKTAQVWNGELIFFPSTVPLNAFVSENFLAASVQKLPEFNYAQHFEYKLNEQRALNPIRWEWPVVIPADELAKDKKTDLKILDKNGAEVNHLMEFASLDPSLMTFGSIHFYRLYIKSLIRNGQILDFEVNIKK